MTKRLFFAGGLSTYAVMLLVLLGILPPLADVFALESEPTFAAPLYAIAWGIIFYGIWRVTTRSAS